MAKLIQVSQYPILRIRKEPCVIECEIDCRENCFFERNSFLFNNSLWVVFLQKIDRNHKNKVNKHISKIDRSFQVLKSENCNFAILLQHFTVYTTPLYCWIQFYVIVEFHSDWFRQFHRFRLRNFWYLVGSFGVDSFNLWRIFKVQILTQSFSKWVSHLKILTMLIWLSKQSKF